MVGWTEEMEGYIKERRIDGWLRGKMGKEGGMIVRREGVGVDGWMVVGMVGRESERGTDERDRRDEREGGREGQE